MRKHFLKIFILFVFFVFSNVVQAARGDLIYEITEFTLNNEEIKINGYAFIHRTQNYVTVYKRDSNGNELSDVIMDNGGMKVKIKLVDANNSSNFIEEEVSLENNSTGYNFYYQMYWNRPDTGLMNKYNNANNNSCNNTGNSNEGPCYYEDIDFNIKIKVDDLLREFPNDETTLKVYIAAYNNNYGKYTDYVEAKTPRIKGKSDYIDVVSGYKNGKVEFTASKALWQKYSSEGQVKNSFYGSTGDIYYIYKTNESTYNDGFKIARNSLGGKNGKFLNTASSPGLYAFCVNTKTGKDACKNVDENNYCTSCGGKLYSAYASWISLVGTNQISIKVRRNRKCDVKEPRPNELICNDSGTLSSVCDELTVNTEKGNAIVKLEQKGTISSLMTPSKIYDGGGFNFGIVYQNNIKWSYVERVPGTELHNAVSAVMNSKIKSYNSYITGINITNLNLVDRNNIPYTISSGMVKQCFSSSNSIDYYGNFGLTVTCIFTFPSSTISYDGKVTYIVDSPIGINNKYYTSFDMFGKFKVTATINGMDRIKETASRNDSKIAGKPWTGDWSDSIDGCEINIYPLLYNTSGKYNFVYRPIDINNPFPNRNAGINWYDWISIQNNIDRIKNTYSRNSKYTAIINNNIITSIKDYNKEHNYLEWDSISDNGSSSFISDYDYVKRGGS